MGFKDLYETSVLSGFSPESSAIVPETAMLGLNAPTLATDASELAQESLENICLNELHETGVLSGFSLESSIDTPEKNARDNQSMAK